MAEIDFSQRALEDIDEIAHYWARFSEDAARAYVKKIYATIALLEQFPNLGKISPELNYPKVREIIAGPYRIFYHVISERRIQIITVHHSAQPFDFDNLRPN
jgi:addiction module RelE/StbE family toxin